MLIQRIKLLERNSVNKIYFWRLTTNNPQRQFSTEMKREREREKKN
jgi:hypothetical protein